ncbi:MAG TPA: hypothetical protein VMS88_03490 [Terriglobales bacterium]|nr:hypothetical protein [Terriglobales bacterium]
MKRSRRRFLRLLAAGTAVAATGPTASLAGAADPARRPRGAAPKPAPRPAPSTPLADEIRKQKDNVDQALKAVRDYDLPMGSDPACTFEAMPVRKPGRES